MTTTEKPAPAVPQVVVNFATAGLGGILGWVAIHPCNTVATRMNLAMMSGSGAQLSFVNYLRTMVKEQGVLSLYSGLEAGIVRQIFYSTSRFGLFEVLRDEMAKYRPTDIWSRLSVGVVSGAMAALISCPAEVTLVRMSNDSTLEASKRRNYTGSEEWGAAMCSFASDVPVGDLLLPLLTSLPSPIFTLPLPCQAW